MLRLLPLIAFFSVALRADIARVHAEPNLERRSALALEEADAALTAARTAYGTGQVQEFRTRVREAGELTELSYHSLQETGKRARRSPKWFKRAEQKMLFILRRVDGLSKDVSAEDRPAVEAVRKQIRDIHDQVLQDIMSRK